jgi:hypothetical protein
MAVQAHQLILAQRARQRGSDLPKRTGRYAPRKEIDQPSSLLKTIEAGTTLHRAKDYPFTPAEFERLYAFRQAVLAGFYSDQLPEDDAHPSSRANPPTTVENVRSGADA